MYRLYCLFLYLMIFFEHTRTSSYNRILGPADLLFQGIEKCPGVKQGVNVFMKQKKYNRTTHVFDLDLETEYDLSDALMMEFKGSLKKEGGYKQGSFLLKRPLCEAYNITLGKVFDDFMNAIGFEECPITVGTYHVRDFYFDNENFDVPQVYGEYKMEFNVWKDDDLICCLNGYYEFVPKQ